MRGVVTVAAALAIPQDAPGRDLLVLVALVVVACSLLLQGGTLPAFVRRLGIEGDDPREAALQRAMVLERAVDAGAERLAELDTTGVDSEVLSELNSVGRRRRHSAWERLGDTPEIETPSDAYRRLRLEMLTAERRKLLSMRDRGNVPTSTLEAALRDTDLEESILAGRQERATVVRDALLLLPDRSRGGCEHLRDADDGRCVTPRTPEGCEECLAEGTPWVHLRICLECGHVGCCDSSPGKHANAHFEATGHPVMRSFEVGEAWRWCFVDKIMG